jgi:hypothetical protein
MIPRNWLSMTGAAQLADVADRLERALNEAKYPRWSYSSVQNGFALVSQMEQIKSDGTPSPEPARWSTDLPWVTNMTLLEFIKVLANATPGYYRVSHAGETRNLSCASFENNIRHGHERGFVIFQALAEESYLHRGCAQNRPSTRTLSCRRTRRWT